MPCNCDHMHPSKHEEQSKLVAKHIAFLLTKLGEPVPANIAVIASNYYGDASKVHELTAKLCRLCEQAPEEFIYNGRDPNARKLADWWDAHKEADEIKLKELEAKRLQTEKENKAKSKLSEEDLRALGINK